MSEIRIDIFKYCVGDGVTNDSAAVQRAIDERNNG